MVIYPCCKINLGLNIVEKRPDGYHNLETVFYPIPLHDTLEVNVMDDEESCDERCVITTTGDAVECNPKDNLVVKAYNIIAKDYPLPRVRIHLNKVIPSQAGLGGGSSDAANMIKLLNIMFNLGMDIPQMEQYALQLGADCPFFINSEPTYACGLGEIFKPLYYADMLKDMWIVLVKPAIAISTREAFAGIKPQHSDVNCRDAVHRPIAEWKDLLTNDFEKTLFPLHKELSEIKAALYEKGAAYAQMSGSGSTVFGIFEAEPHRLDKSFNDCRVYTLQL